MIQTARFEVVKVDVHHSGASSARTRHITYEQAPEDPKFRHVSCEISDLSAKFSSSSVNKDNDEEVISSTDVDFFASKDECVVKEGNVGRLSITNVICGLLRLDLWCKALAQSMRLIPQ
ncbi:hypothetical protein AAHC03_04914 [Spirometra sp. Aus1]